MSPISLAILLAFSVPALAQDAETAAGSQYDGDPDALSIGDIPKSFAGNAAEGAGAVNAALAGSQSSGEPGAAPDSLAGLTMLPETGGASLLGLCAGFFLSGAGVLLLILRTKPWTADPSTGP